MEISIYFLIFIIWTLLVCWIEIRFERARVKIYKDGYKEMVDRMYS